MIRGIYPALVVIVMACAAPHASSKELPPVGVPAIAPAPTSMPAEFKAGGAVLARFDFEGAGGVGDPQGWTEHDLTPPFLQHWRVEDFAGLAAPYAPLGGSQSMWCGVRPDPANPSIAHYQSLPGYGQNWLTAMTSGAVLVDTQLSVVFDARWSLEAAYDFLYVEYRVLPGGSWNTLTSYDGEDAVDDEQLDVPPGHHGSEVQFRFLVSTDASYSDEDGNFDSNGAAVLDDLRLINNGIQISLEDFEGEALEADASADGFWSADPPRTPFGDYTDLVGPAGVLQEDPAGDNLTNFWAFFVGSNETYRCGQIPSQPAVPHPLDPADPQWKDSFSNEIRSPWLPLDVDEDGNPVVLGPDASLTLAASIYGDYPLNLGVYCTPKVRFLVGGVVQIWRTPGFVYYGLDKAWEHRQIDFSVPAAATEVQVAYEVSDLAYALSGDIVDPEACHTHGPLIDDVRVAVYSGPAPIVVTNNLGGGPGSLYEALEEAALSPGLDTIEFHIPGPGPHEIFSVGLTFDSPVYVDGFSQPGSSPNTNPVGQPSNAVMKIVLNTSFMHNLIDTGGAGTTLRGIVFQSDNDNLNGTIHSLADQVTVTGCYFGTDVTGLQPSGYEPRRGIVSFGHGLMVGGPDPGDRCILSGHTFEGILIADNSAIIQGCYVGTDATGSGDMGNATNPQILGDGIAVNVPFGEGYTQVFDSIIAFNHGAGLRAKGNSTVHARRTSFFDNTGLGIDSFGLGPTSDDTFAPTPIITSVDLSTGSVTGEFDALISGLDYELDFFSNPECDPSGYGEGKVLLGTYALTSTGSPTLFTAELGPLGYAGAVTATLTLDGGRTSEFSPCFLTENTPAGQNITVTPDNGASGSSLVFADVSLAGNTSVSELSVPPEEPEGFDVGGASYWDIQTTATFSGTVEVCFDYDEADLGGDEANVVLLHYDETAMEWVEITTTLDTANDRVCGETNHLSPFVVATTGGISATPDLAINRWTIHNKPNPFNPMTSVILEIPRAGTVRVEVFDVAGRRIRTLADGYVEAGIHELVWRGRSGTGGEVSSGVYYVRLVGDDINLVHKMLLLR